MSVPGPDTRTQRQASSRKASSGQQSASLPTPPDGGSVRGPFLDRCRCSRRPATPITPRSAEEIQARHDAAVARARRSGWGAWIAPKQPLRQALRIVTDPTGRGWAA
jgi:hypothetical protein